MLKAGRSLITSFMIIFISVSCVARQESYTAFTVHDGLPSNNVYRCVADDSGFLWVATDAGVARFDGKRFQIFTMKDGLPDNDVLEVVKENNGRIWVNCFKQKPAYFDEVRNRFINAKEDSNLAKVSEGTSAMLLSPLKKGGVMFSNEKGSYIFRDKKLIQYAAIRRSLSIVVKENDDGTIFKYTLTRRKEVPGSFQFHLFRIKNNEILDSIPMYEISQSNKRVITRALVNGNNLYIMDPARNSCIVFSDLRVNPVRFKRAIIRLPESFLISNSGISNKELYIVGQSGKVYLFDIKTLKALPIVGGAHLPNSILTNSVYTDSEGNSWISTYGNGLLLCRKHALGSLALPSGLHQTAFMSITRKPDGNLLAGNVYGQIVEFNGKNSKLHHIVSPNKELRVRKIIYSQGKVFAFSERGIYVDYTRGLVNPVAASGTYPAKTAIAYNDSIIIHSMVSGPQVLNTTTGQVTTALNLIKRVTALAKASDRYIYFGSTDGLYKFDYARRLYYPLTKNHPLLNQRIVALCTTPDSLLWVATASEGVLVVKNDHVLYQLTENNRLISNALQSICAAGPGKIWAGSGRGISLISYHFEKGKFRYSIGNLSVNDGLSDNSINEMIFDRDTIYAATGNGIAVIPAGIVPATFNIPVQLVHMSINQRDTILSSAYRLRHDQQYIQMQFAGIELNGHFKNLQYSLDENKNWISLDENKLTVQLTSGDHLLRVRAVDVNGNISKIILNIRFDIATPFWKAVWFWIIVASIIQVIIIYLVNQRQKKRKEAKLAVAIAGLQTASLEQQAFTSLMNPHFMFNALNSIQHYINVQDRQNANRYLSDFASLIRKNFEGAQQSFIPLELELENIRIYLRLEQMRFNGRFTYSIRMDEELDPEDWMVPTMILQPLLENALLHGIMHSPVHGEIQIELWLQEKNLLIGITDNGIGIVKSMALKEDTGEHKSHGMELIRKRITALSRFGTQAITIAMAPAYTSETNPGNRITLFIPSELYEAWLRAQKR